MHLYEILAVIIYLIALIGVGVFSFRKNMTEADFIIGGRSMGSWLTALAAHASDMSSWLFMGYPSLIFLEGPIRAWTGIGLLIFMYLNWQFVAPKIRVATEQWQCMTFSSFFENRVADTSGVLRVFTALMSLFFFTIYISAGLVGMGYLLNMLFDIPYQISIILSILIIVPYVFSGGFVTLAWIDLFQGFFLLLMILFVPLYLLPKIGGVAGITYSFELKNIAFSLLPEVSFYSWLQVIFLFVGWGLGYFGQPHIVTKFMGIKQVREINKSKRIGMTWMLLAFVGATLVGLIASAFFQEGIANPELIFTKMVRDSFHPFLIGLIFCAILAATINANGSQILVLASTLSEDLYKRVFRRHASSKELLRVSRTCVILVGIGAYLIASFQISTIYKLVLYAWSGLGSSFGPLVLFSLYYNRLNRYGAWAGILSGGLVSALWPFINIYFTVEVPPLIPGFLISSVCIYLFSQISQPLPTNTEV
jgi:sodium/proline symporter